MGNSKYVVEWQPYPDLLVYVLCPIDGEGCSCTMHGNYLLPINDNLENKECTDSVSEDEPIDSLAPECHVGALLGNHLAGSQLDSTHSLSLQQDELVSSEITRLTTTHDTHTPVLRHSYRTTKEQLLK